MKEEKDEWVEHEEKEEAMENEMTHEGEAAEEKEEKLVLYRKPNQLWKLLGLGN